MPFLRSRHGSDRVGRLWSLDLGSGEERLVADPETLLAEADEQLSAAERARRERARESAAGIVAYAVDEAAHLTTFALSSRLWLAELTPGGATRELDAVGPVLDPRLDPTGTWVAYVGAGALRVIRSDGSDARVLAEPDGPDVTWAWPSSWPPRRWTGSAATGGRPTARRCSPHGWTTLRCCAGTSPTRPTPTRLRPRSLTPSPGRPTPT